MNIDHFDLLEDWEIWDNLETVNYITDKGTLDYCQSNVTAKRRVLTFREVVSGAYTPSDLVWVVPVQFIPPRPLVKRGDRILETLEGTEWTILEGRLNTYRTWWRLICRDLVSSAQLNDRIEILRPDKHQDRAGVRDPNYKVIEANVPSRIVEIDASDEDRLGKRQMTRRFSCYVARQLKPDGNFRIRDATGRIFGITGYQSADRFDVLQELNLEIVK